MQTKQTEHVQYLPKALSAAVKVHVTSHVWPACGSLGGQAAAVTAGVACYLMHSRSKLTAVGVPCVGWYKQCGTGWPLFELCRSV